MLWWLISEIQLEKYFESGTKKDLTIVIIVRNNTKVFILYAKGSRFRKILKIVEKYEKARPSSICISYARINHNRLGKSRDRGL